MRFRQHYGYRDFTDQPEHFRVVRWLYTRVWLSAERPTVLFDLTTARLVEQKILLPGVTILERLIARVRDRAAARLWRMLAHAPTPEQHAHLEQLLTIPPDQRVSLLDQLRRAPTRISAPALVTALERLQDIRALGIGALQVPQVPLGRVKALARYAAAAWAPTIARMPDERRMATLVAFASIFEATAQDDALDLLDQLIQALLARAEKAGRQQRLRTLHDLDASALRLQEVCAVVLDSNCPDTQVRVTAFRRVSPEQLAADVARVVALARRPDEQYYEELLDRYGHVRRFLPAVLRTIFFRGVKAGQPVLDALAFFASLEQSQPPKLHTAPTAVVTGAWRRLVLDMGEVVDRRAYTFCVLERLQDALHRRDVFVSPSERWNDPRARLLHGAAWETVRPHVARTLNRSLNSQVELRLLQQQLDAAYRRTATRLGANPSVRIERELGHDHPVLTGLDKLEDPPSLVALRKAVAARLPLADLPDIVLEIHGCTGFLDEFTHLTEEQARVDDLALSVCAVLIAEACNIGLEPLVDPNVRALRRGRLTWVQQNYVRAETLARSNARLVDYQATVPLAQRWGGGEVASADGLRFIVPVRTLHAGSNAKYFPAARGVTYYNFTSDQFTQFHSILIPGTLHEAPFLLEGLLEQQTSLRPVEIISDTAGYSDVIFGLFWILGYQFSPRLADIGGARFWRLNAATDYGTLNKVARHRINVRLIGQNWDDILRVAGSLKLGTVRASDLIRALQAGKRPSLVTRAVAELGRIAKTLYLLAYLDDESYRRRILTQLNRGETRHTLARVVFHGQRGELRQPYREGQEDQLGALGLLSMYWCCGTRATWMPRLGNSNARESR